jgi:acyl-coenzyme A thioesterase PaaI-like protein
MTPLHDVLSAARASGDWNPLLAWMPYAQFLNMRIQIEGDQFRSALPFHDKLIGNPQLPALHGGAIGGFLECTGMFYLLWHMESSELPKIIDFSIEFLRTGRAEATHASVVMVKQGQRVANVRVQAWQSDADKPIAIGHGNFMLKPGPP